jgi:hypothetical protein
MIFCSMYLYTLIQYNTMLCTPWLKSIFQQIQQSNIVQCHTTVYCTILCNTLLCITLLYNTLPYNNTQSKNQLSSTIKYSFALHIMCCLLEYYILLNSTVLYSVILYCTVYHFMLWNSNVIHGIVFLLYCTELCLIETYITV